MCEEELGRLDCAARELGEREAREKGGSPSLRSMPRNESRRGCARKRMAIVGSRSACALGAGVGAVLGGVGGESEVGR